LIVVLLGPPLLAAEPPAPAVSITLGPRQAQVAPQRRGFTHTGGGNIDVAQPAGDTIVVTMTGVAVAGAHPCKDSVATLSFDLMQSFDVSIDKPGVKKIKLTLEGRVLGLLRSHAHGGGTAEISLPGHAAVLSGTSEVVSLGLPARAVGGGENLSVNDREGPVTASIVAGSYALHEIFGITATHSHSLKLCKAASAEFAPDPALDPLWISYWEPFHGAIKKDLGFQLILKVAPE
jgi:hypothetical protein